MVRSILLVSYGISYLIKMLLQCIEFTGERPWIQDRIGGQAQENNALEGDGVYLPLESVFLWPEVDGRGLKR